MVPAVSRRIPRAPRYSGYRYARSSFGYGAVTRYGRPFQTVPLASPVRLRGPTTPATPGRRRFGLLPVRSPLLGELTFCSLLLRVLRCFSSPRSPRRLAPVAGLCRPGCPIRMSWDRCALAAPPSFSQLATSFFASESLGIHRPPLSAFPFRERLPAFASRTISFSFPSCQRSSFVENKGLEPLTPCVQGRCSKPTELIPRFV